ncbi:hypothetical protein HUJ04_007307 [Dendroctonus ponderosae]|nr:hypothetical protein HUJ04_007307 [Dendroctonus ponderosae]
MYEVKENVDERGLSEVWTHGTWTGLKEDTSGALVHQSIVVCDSARVFKYLTGRRAGPFCHKVDDPLTLEMIPFLASLLLSILHFRLTGLLFGMSLELKSSNIRLVHNSWRQPAPLPSLAADTAALQQKQSCHPPSVRKPLPKHEDGGLANPLASKDR